MKHLKATKKINAPRLLNKSHRVPATLHLPEAVKYGLELIAKSEGESFSWACEQSLIDYFRLNRPVYKIKRKE